MKVRTRRFSGRCARHKSYNPGVDGRADITGNCSRCNLLSDIWEAALRLNGLIRKFDPNFDDAQSPRQLREDDERQMSLLENP